MIKTLKFYKEEENKWYVDLPEWIEQGGTKNDLEMVCGADVFLDLLSKLTHEVHVTFSNEPFEGYVYELHKTAEDELGGSYIVFSPLIYPLEVWLCNVTKYIFKEFPQIIFLR